MKHTKSEHHLSLRVDDDLLGQLDLMVEAHEKTFNISTTRSAMLRAALVEGLKSFDQRFTAMGILAPVGRIQ